MRVCYVKIPLKKIRIILLSSFSLFIHIDVGMERKNAIANSMQHVKYNNLSCYTPSVLHRVKINIIPNRIQRQSRCQIRDDSKNIDNVFICIKIIMVILNRLLILARLQKYPQENNYKRSGCDFFRMKINWSFYE